MALGRIAVTYLVGVRVDDHALAQNDLFVWLFDADFWKAGWIMTRPGRFVRRLRLRRRWSGAKPASLWRGYNRVLSLELVKVVPIKQG